MSRDSFEVFMPRCRGIPDILSLKDPNHHNASNTNREPIEDPVASSLTSNTRPVISAEPRASLLTHITISVTGHGESDLAQISSKLQFAKLSCAKV